MQTMFVTKKPGGNSSPWHQDEHPIPTRDRSLTGVWIPLSDVTVDKGCLWIVPGSHRSGVIYQRYKHNLPDVDSMPIARGFDDTSAIPIEMQAESVLFFPATCCIVPRKTSAQPIDRLSPCTTVRPPPCWPGRANAITGASSRFGVKTHMPPKDMPLPSRGRRWNRCFDRKRRKR